MGRQRLSFVFAAVGLMGTVVAGCGSDDEPSATSSTVAVTSSTSAGATTTAAGGATTTPVAGATTTAAAGAGQASTTVAGAATSTTAAGRVVTSPDASVKNGDSGSGVEQIQRALNAYGYKLGVDGKFGNVTETAVRDFQKKNGLGVDGIVGPKTWAKLQTPPSGTATTAAGATSTTAAGATTTTSGSATTAPSTTAGP